MTMAAAITKVGYCWSWSKNPLMFVPPTGLFAVCDLEAVGARDAVVWGGAGGGHICCVPHWPHLLAERDSVLLQFGLEQRLVSALTAAPVSISYSSASCLKALSHRDEVDQVTGSTMGHSTSLLPSQPTGSKEDSMEK